jgi:aminopeptidase-like protein
MKEIFGGFILTCTSGPDDFSYKQTYLKNHLIDEIVLNSLRELKIKPKIYPFDIRGSDERQYSSPFFRIPVGTICKGKYHEYDYYHTSKDNLDFVDPKNLIETLFVYLKIIENLEKTKSFFKHNYEQNNKNNYCEPMLSKYDLYPTLGGSIGQKVSSSKSPPAHENDIFDAIGWLLFYSDGFTSINEISKQTKIPKLILVKAAKKLINVNLLQKVISGDI